MPERGVLFACWGAPLYKRECAAAAARVRALHPDMHITVFCDEAPPPKEIRAVANDIKSFPADILKEAQQKGVHHIPKIYAIAHSPYHRTLFLDTDVKVRVNVLGDLLRLLEKYEFAAAHSPSRASRNNEPPPTSGIPQCFATINSGVLALRSDAEAIKKLMRHWDALYRKRATHFDQPVLRAALWDVAPRMAVLPPEYNVRPTTHTTKYEPKIEHWHDSESDGKK